MLDRAAGGVVEGKRTTLRLCFVRELFVRESGGMQSDVTVRARVG